MLVILQQFRESFNFRCAYLQTREPRAIEIRTFESPSSKGAFLVTDTRVFNGPLGGSLRLFARTAHSAHSLRSALLCSALL